MSTASVHRFRNTVALSVGNGQTVYICAGLAQELAKALEAAAADIIRSAYTSSNLPPVTLDLGRQPR